MAGRFSEGQGGPGVLLKPSGRGVHSGSQLPVTTEDKAYLRTQQRIAEPRETEVG
jgi:hypothetical protein